jgi:outer membrane protein with glycine zipper
MHRKWTYRHPHVRIILTVMKTNLLILTSIVSIGLTAGCHHHSRAEKAAAIGAASGAAVGAVLGNQSGNPQTGAVVGAAVGGVAGGAYGASRDRQADGNHALGSNDSGDDYYLSLMTPDELDILRARARASGQSDYQLTDFLTAQERANLRRRDPSAHQIGQ